MKQFLKNVQGIFDNDKMGFQERVFCAIDTLGMGTLLIALLECILFSRNEVVIGNLFAMLLICIWTMILIVRFRLTNTATVLGYVMLVGILLPHVFFYCGGMYGPAFFSLMAIFVYVLLFFQSIKMYVFVVLAVFSYVICCYLSVQKPELVKPLPDVNVMLICTMISVNLMGIMLGLMIKYYVRSYINKQNMIEKQQRELEEMSDSRVNFFASMSHEIRSPINTIIGLNEIILRESTEEGTLAYAKNVKNAGKMLLNLVNDILDVSQMETNKMSIVRNIYSTKDLFKEMIDIVSVRIQEKNLDFYIQIDENLPSLLHGDIKRIQQIMLNLLTNAIKYTDTGSITLIATMEALDEDEINLKISVKDTGIGIKKEDIENLYSIFKRVDQKKNQKIEGSGLGLNITKTLVDLMDGTISVDSIYKRGSTFTVSLPQGIIDEKPIGDMLKEILERNAVEDKYQQLFEAPEARILIVDDIPTNCMVLKKLLEKTQMQIDCVNSGAECLACTKEKAYDLILLDHLMPEMDGVATLRELRRQTDGLCKDCAVIALTANTGADMEEYYYNQGFDSYAEKPVDGPKLENTILSFLPENLIEYRNMSEKYEKNHVRRAVVKRKKRILITTDCVAEIPAHLVEKYGIRIMYLYIRTDKGRFADTIEINSDNLSYYVTDNATTAFSDSVSVEEFEEFFAEQLTNAEEIIHISLDAHSGKSYDVAVEAATSFGHVHVVDSTQICGAQGIIALYAAQLVQMGKSTDYILEQLDKVKENIVAKYIMPSVSIFYQNGYTSKPVMQICKMLNIHPIVQMKKKKIGISGIAFGDMQKARKKMIKKMLRQKKRINEDVLFITHVALGNKEQNELKEYIADFEVFNQVYFNRASFSTACNGGIGSFGIAYCKKK